MVFKSAFTFMCIFACTQIVPNGMTAFLSYVQLVAMGLSVAGAVFSDTEKLRSLRWIGLLVSYIVGFILIWILMCNDWCAMFFFAKFFSEHFAQA